MTEGTPSLGARTRAEMHDAATAFAMLDDAMDQLRAAAKSSAEQLAHCASDDSETVAGVLATWANSNAVLERAIALLEHANRLLVPPTRPIGIEVTRPGRKALGGSPETT